MIALESQPTINIEGLVAGYTGPGGKTVLPHRAVAKIDMRLVPDMTASGTLALLKEHLAKKGFGDIEVNMSGGYDPNQTSPDTKLIQAQMTTYKKLGQDPMLWPRSAGSWPGYIFTNRAAESSGRTLRTRARHRRSCSERVLPDRLQQSKGRGTGCRGRLVCRVSVRPGIGFVSGHHFSHAASRSNTIRALSPCEPPAGAFFCPRCPSRVPIIFVLEQPASLPCEG